MPEMRASRKPPKSPELTPGILVDEQIRAAIRARLLSIKPFDEDALQPATYDLSVGDTAVVSTSHQPINLRENPLLTLEPYAMAALLTEEVLTLSQRIVGRVGPRSNLLSYGIFVGAGPQIDPGFNGRLFVNILNMTDHPFLIRYRTKFLTAEFHALSADASRAYSGPFQNRTDFTDEQINSVTSRGGPSLKDVHHALMDVQTPIKDAAAWAREIPVVVDFQQEILRKTSELLRGLKELQTERTVPLIVPIMTLAPEPYELTQVIHAVVQPVEQGFVATFFDANISTSGDTQQEALSNLKSLIVETIEELESEPTERLGPEPLHQRQVLKDFLQKKADANEKARGRHS